MFDIMWTLVTGASKGLGAALCIALAQKGHNIVVHYHSRAQLAQEVVAQCRSYGVQANALCGDFSSAQGVTDFAAHYLNQFPQTNVLINNIGVYLTHPATNTTIEQWQSLMQLNLTTPFILSTYFAQCLKEKNGQIVNIGVSGLHRQVAQSYAAIYFLTKQSLWHLTLSLAREWAHEGVRVNMVSPGQLDISTDLPNDISVLPMQRAATCAEICRAVLFLVDPHSAYITGQNIEVAGGLGLK